MSRCGPNLQKLIDCDGESTVRHRVSAGRVAAAMQKRQVYALLHVDDGELIPDLLDRPDAAIAKAFEDECYTDVINRRESVKT